MPCKEVKYKALKHLSKKEKRALKAQKDGELLKNKMKKDKAKRTEKVKGAK